MSVSFLFFADMYTNEVILGRGNMFCVAPEVGSLQRAIDVVKLQKKASISQLHIGYTRAARLIDQMEEKGIVGPATEDSRFREVLVLGDDRQFSMSEDE